MGKKDFYVAFYPASDNGGICFYKEQQKKVLEKIDRGCFRSTGDVVSNRMAKRREFVILFEEFHG